MTPYALFRTLTILLENMFVASSYKAIVDRIAAKAQAEARLFLSHRVTTVGYVLNSNPPQSKVYHLDLNNREAYITQCDAVVITVPLGCLKRGIPAIHPKPLPSPIAAGIQGLGYGQLEKAYLTFPNAWWNTGPDGPNFFQFLHPLYDNENPTNAILDCMDLSLLPGDTSQPTLLFYFHGPLAYNLVIDLERFEGNEAEAEKFLIRRFRPYFSLLPNFDPENDACTPVAACMTRWRTDPWSLGSYTNFPISGMRDTPHVQLEKGIEALRKGIPERGLYFAGEHTAPFDGLGTVAGAYTSGEMVARRIVESRQPAEAAKENSVIAD
jgi:Flavin containing amine oxidoreductase